LKNVTSFNAARERRAPHAAWIMPSIMFFDRMTNYNVKPFKGNLIQVKSPLTAQQAREMRLF